MAELLMSMGCDVNVQSSSGKVAVHYAARQCNMDLMRLLVEKGGALTDIETNESELPIHFAVETEFTQSEEMIRYLVKKVGNDVYHCDSDGWTPLLRACGENCVGTLFIDACILTTIVYSISKYTCRRRQVSRRRV